MTKATFEYKCRRCGNVFSTPTTTDGEWAFNVLNTVALGHIDPSCDVRLHTVHTDCRLGSKTTPGLGIADLIGCRIEELP